MRSWSGRRTFPLSAAVVSGLLALASATPALAQPKPAAKPAAAPPAKPAAAAPAKPAAAPPAKPADAKPAAAAPAKPADAKPADAKPAVAGAPVKPAADKPAAGDKTAAAKPAEKPAKPLTDKQKKDGAKKAYKEAEAKFEKQDYAGALDLYKEADSLLPGERPKFKIAVCLDKLGKVTEAVAAYQTFLDAKPDAEKLKDPIAEANTRMDALKKTPGKVKVATVPEAPPNLKISVDGVEQPAGNELSLAPGKHTIQVKADDFEPASQEVEVAFAESKSVSLEMKKVEAPPPPPPVAVVEPPPVKPVEPPKPPPPAPRSKVPAYVTLGFAGAGAVVGTIFGVMALGAKSDFDSMPTTDNADKADRNALISDMSYAVAITFGVTGAVLLFSKDSTEETKAASTHKTAPRKAFIAPYAGPTGAGAAAHFTF